MVSVEVALIIVCMVMALAWAYFTAQRLNSLHIRTDAALAQLQFALDRRAAVAAALAPSLLPLAREADATALVYHHFEDRAEKERALTAAMAREFRSFPAVLVDAESRVQLAHRFYNEAVSDTRALRLRPLVKLCRLGGTAPLPNYFDYTTAQELRA